MTSIYGWLASSSTLIYRIHKFTDYIKENNLLILVLFIIVSSSRLYILYYTWGYN